MRERKKEKDIGDEVKVCIYRGTKKVIREERETKGRECRKWHCRLHVYLRRKVGLGEENVVQENKLECASELEMLDSSYANWVVGVFVFDVTLVGAILNVLGWTQCGGEGSGCAIWFGDLLDIRLIPNAGQDLYIRLAVSETGMRFNFLRCLSREFDKS